VGNTIWVDVEGRPDDKLPPDNSIMLRLMEQLDELSDRLRVAKLSEFFDYSVIEAEYADELPDLEVSSRDVSDSSGTWFDPGRALEAVRAIHDRLSADFAALAWEPDRSRDHWPEALMQELNHCRTMLEDAGERGRKFRFLVVP
jgi:hypothetical protein